MIRILVAALTILTLSACSPSKPKPIEEYFEGRVGCFLLYDVNRNKLMIEYNKKRCEQRIAPDSSFKIPLSIMAFDQNLINQDTHFKWDGKDKGLASWNHDQTPKEWLSNSVIWISQEITQQLGMEKIQEYLKKFDYGNQDFSGDPGKNNGLTEAWLSSSLKISGYEQLNFLIKLVNNTLPVSPQSMFYTKENMYLERSDRGWRLYGKTGAGIDSDFPNMPGYQDGWFIGFVQKDNQIYIVVLNYSDHQQPKELERAGVVAKRMTQAILKDQAKHYFNYKD